MFFADTDKHFEIGDEVEDTYGKLWIVDHFFQSCWHYRDKQIDWIVCHRMIDGIEVHCDFSPRELGVPHPILDKKKGE